MTDETATNERTYAQDIARIEQIIERLRSNDCDIDRMLDYVNEAAALLTKCQNKLEQTGASVNRALLDLAGDGKPSAD